MFTDVMNKKKKVDLGIFFYYQIDKGNQLKNVFRSDSLSRRSYTLFGDNLSFDTTPKTHRYSMVFVPFMGLNDHR